jgi:glycerol-3-phosphate dehydrogenase
VDTRRKNVERLKSETFDLVIVGGGITGAGVARDAASRGMKVAVVEAHDFASGTSSRSSKLIHGGVRYLENFEFGLVFEALSERALLFKIAPHLVHPLRFLIPIYRSSRVGYFKMMAGMWLYDMLALFETPKMHESLDGDSAKERVPVLDGRELVGAMEYSDAYTDDDRLVIETLRDAHRMGAVICNYTEVMSCQKQGETVQGLEVVDHLTGQSFNLQGAQFVSGVGPWTDIFGQRIDQNWRKTLRPTKGVHLVFHRKKIPVDRAVVMAVESRIIFVIPRHEMVIVGTTDTDYNVNPADVTTTADDVQYLLNALEQYFPSLSLSENDIVSTYCGVRPLVNDGAESEGKTSREHKIWHGGPNLTFIAGGKYTTYRKISEEAVDFVLQKLPFAERMSFKPSDTKKPLNPKISPDLYERSKYKVEEWAEAYQVSPKMVTSLIERHGDEAEEILRKVHNEYNMYSANEAMWMGEAHFAIENSMCHNLVDFYWRRSPLFLAMRDHGMKYLNPLLKVFSERLNWSAAEKEKQQDALMTAMQRELSWRSLVG